MPRTPPRDADAIVVGSGPSGVSVAPSLLDAGMRVTLVDGGRRPQQELSPPGAYHELRRSDAEQWRWFLGPRLEGLQRGGPPSPKFDAPGWKFAYEGFQETLGITSRGFAMVGSLAAGGLSHIWGAGLALYDDVDLAEFPIELDDLLPSYERVARRMGVSGFEADDLATRGSDRIASQRPIELSQNAERLLRRYQRRRRHLHRLGVHLGRSRIAVLTEPRGDRQACDLRDACLWGCARQSVWNAAFDLEQLRQRENLDYRAGWLVRRIEAEESGYRLVVRRQDDGAGMTLRAPVVVLAAGSLATTRLVLAFQNRHGERVPVLSSPTAAFALWLPERTGSAVASRGFSLAQLSFTANGAEGDAAYGNLFSADGIPVSLLADRLAFTRPGALRIYRRLQPALLLANCYLPAVYYRNTACLEHSTGGDDRLVVRGDVVDATLRLRLEALERQLRRAFRKLGAMLLPGSFTVSDTGSDLRPTGMLPMAATPTRGQLDATGELVGSPGLYVADLSGFPSLPAKHPTFTMMANADRIGGIIADRWRRTHP